MGSCASKSADKGNGTSQNQQSGQSTQGKRQQQSQAIQQKNKEKQQQRQREQQEKHSQQQPQSPTDSNADGTLKNGSDFYETLKHPSDSSNDNGHHLKEKHSQELSNGTANNNLITNPVDAAGNSNPSKDVKVLLLGSGESGKSTIVKQMKILHSDGYTQDELEEYRPFVYKNILDCIKNVINAIIDLQPDLIKKPDSPQLEEDREDDLKVTGLTSENNHVPITNGSAINEPPKHRKHILEYDMLNEILDYDYPLDSNQPFNADVAINIKKVYETPEVKEFMLQRQGEFYLIDSTDYFLSNLDRICLSGNYEPNVMDVLRTRKKTSGIFTYTFDLGNGLNMNLFDVGGQRSERKKWINCFDNVSTIIFCVALSEYDNFLLEESNTNRLEESLALFDSVVNSRWFARTTVVLFLNKIDVFAEKLKYSPLENFFPDYKGGPNISNGVKYILWRFNKLNRSGLNIYPHVTQATDTSNIELVMAAVKQTILENSLKDSGIL
ncbi:G Protein Alpha subunit, putative [Candida dubliniensis CD36]|uniref:Nucleotide binding regulatory protein, putative n=1 Tax=Candida dubliniensis (strain CD36 / ATCC MYA-646 / CBS 7987 / NCPF 3949 / NRRL Y-17841) TaxID=573826 RepID=B9WDJ3_CANDC|nr:G Protein Alpha subunit, putative [Candida dubliniensis CD36]CAX42749.1 G Protein Alpha subunit, putative [Candida dubliniensis CD36]